MRTRRSFLCGALSKRLGGPWKYMKVGELTPVLAAWCRIIEARGRDASLEA